jgi:rhodanese-related sulfurtransferase
MTGIKRQSTAGLSADSQNGFVGKLLLRMLALLGFAVALAGVLLLANPKAPNYGQGLVRPGEIELAKATRTARPILWVDARAKEDYEAAHVQGAILINEDDYYVQIGSLLNVYKKGELVVVYCSMEGCDSSLNISRLLKKETGIKEIYALHGGWEFIKKSNLRTLSTKDEASEAKAAEEARKKAEESDDDPSAPTEESK